MQLALTKQLFAISESLPLGETFDSKGNLLSSKSADGHFVQNTYDENGNDTSYLNSATQFLSEKTYDGNGRQLSYKDNGGGFSKCEYDENGFQTLFETGRFDKVHLWWKKTYDKNGNVLTADGNDSIK